MSFYFTRFFWSYLWYYKKTELLHSESDETGFPVLDVFILAIGVFLSCLIPFSINRDLGCDISLGLAFLSLDSLFVFAVPIKYGLFVLWTHSQFWVGNISLLNVARHATAESYLEVYSWNGRRMPLNTMWQSLIFQGLMLPILNPIAKCLNGIRNQFVSFSSLSNVKNRFN